MKFNLAAVLHRMAWRAWHLKHLAFGSLLLAVAVVPSLIIRDHATVDDAATVGAIAVSFVYVILRASIALMHEPARRPRRPATPSALEGVSMAAPFAAASLFFALMVITPGLALTTCVCYVVADLRPFTVTMGQHTLLAALIAVGCVIFMSLYTIAAVAWKYRHRLFGEIAYVLSNSESSVSQRVHAHSSPAE